MVNTELNKHILTSEFWIEKEVIYNTNQILSNFATGENFNVALDTAFEVSGSTALRQEFISGNFLEGLDIELLSSQQLEGAFGAYAEANDTIYLSSDFLETASLEQSTDVLLEEVGHAIDARFNFQDTAGDEGAIFSALAQGDNLSEAELAALRQEDDTNTITVAGQSLKVEQANLIVNDDGGGDYTTIADAINNASSGDTIVVTGGSNNIHNEQGITVDENLTIKGDGDLTIQGDGSDRVFNIDDGNDNVSSRIQVTIQDLSVEGGNATNGGGILNDNEILTLSNVIVSENTATNNGGGIYLDDSSVLTIENSTISNNSANEGGGIYSDGGAISIENTTVNSNTATNNGGGIRVEDNDGLTLINTAITQNQAMNGNGGGIDSSNNFTATLINTTVEGNTSFNQGGGIANSNGTLQLVNSTVSNNLASGSNAGGIFNNNDSTATLANSTVSNNIADNLAGGILNNRGSTLNLNNATVAFNGAQGVLNANSGSGSTLNLTNSIVANNDGNDLNNSGTSTITASGNNIVADRSFTDTNVINEDPNLIIQLADNGGPTPTHALDANSPAHNAGDDTLVPQDTFDADNNSNTSESLDQRGFARVANGQSDIGAYENQVPNANFVTDSTDEETATGNITIIDNGDASDPDPNDTLAVIGVSNLSITSGDVTGLNGDEGTITVTDSDGDGNDDSVEYDPNSELELLDDGQKATATFGYTVSDGNATATAQVKVTINGVNDAPTAQNDTATTDEDNSTGNISVLGNLATDPDQNDTLTLRSASLVDVTSGDVTGLNGNEGTVTVTDSDGDAIDDSLEYNPNGELELLGDNETATATVEYEVSDGTATDTAELDVTINGVNDTPEINSKDRNQTFDATNIDLNSGTTVANLNATDVDQNDNLSWNITSGNPSLNGESLFEINDSGKISLKQDVEIRNFLNRSIRFEEELRIEVNDGNGGTDSTNATIQLVNNLSDQASTSRDFLFGTNSRDAINLRSGDDIFYGQDRSDIVIGEAGNDFLFGRNGDDVLFGDGLSIFGGGDGEEPIGIGQESLNGSGYSDDTLYGDDGDDVLFGGFGDDLLYAGSGDDVLFGGFFSGSMFYDSGEDTLYAGSGSDTFVLVQNDSSLQLEEEHSADTIYNFDTFQDQIRTFVEAEAKAANNSNNTDIITTGEGGGTILATLIGVSDPSSVDITSMIS